MNLLIQEKHSKKARPIWTISPMFFNITPAWQTKMAERSFHLRFLIQKAKLLGSQSGFAARLLHGIIRSFKRAWKIAPALAAGNTIVMKPSEITPLTTIKVFKLMEEAGVPKGVANLVLGPGATVGDEPCRKQRCRFDFIYGRN